MIKRRLQAEMKTVGRDDLKMLSRLLQEDDLEVRTYVLHSKHSSNALCFQILNAGYSLHPYIDYCPLPQVFLTMSISLLRSSVSEIRSVAF